MRVEILPNAEEDIIHQFRYYLVDQDAPRTAFRFREAVHKSIEGLKPYPHIGAPISGSTAGLRSWPVRDFEVIRIYYVATDDVLRVIRVLHGRRDIRRILTNGPKG